MFGISIERKQGPTLYQGRFHHYAVLQTDYFQLVAPENPNYKEELEVVELKI